MPVDPVTDGTPITASWGNQVSTSVGALEAAPGYKPGGTDVAVADGGTGASNATGALANLGLGPAAVPAFAGIKFPAAPAPSTDLTTFDDYREGTWVPSVRFNNSQGSWAVSAAAGIWVKVGGAVIFTLNYTAVVTKGTGAGAVVVEGFPIPAVASSRFACEMQGWTKAGYTQITGLITAGSSSGNLRASGSGQTIVNLAVGDITDGATVGLYGGGIYMAVSGTLLGELASAMADAAPLPA